MRTCEWFQISREPRVTGDQRTRNPFVRRFTENFVILRDVDKVRGFKPHRDNTVSHTCLRISICTSV